MDESLITPELQEHIGVASEPVTLTITPLLVKRVREMLAGGPVAESDAVPPAVLLMPDAGREVALLPGLPGSGLVTGDELELRRHLRMGETLTSVSRLADLSERFGSRLGHTLSVRHEWTFSDVAGTVVGFSRRSLAYYLRAELPPREEAPLVEAGVAPPLEEHPGVDPHVAQEGDPLTARLLTPTLEQVVRYMAVTWNITRIFFDAEAARAAGLPGTLIPGPLKLALLAEAVLAWAGPGALLESIRAAHRRPDTPGRPLLFGGSVMRARQIDGGRRLECEVWIQNAAGERSAVGAATVRLSRQA